jgi:glycosyltransferase involved in cell wall biosynthesis
MNHDSISSSLEQLSAVETRKLRELLLDATGDDASSAASDLDQISFLQQLLGASLCRKLGIYRVPADFRLSVIMPVYNEIRTLPKVIERVQATGLPIELIIVDDGSSDGSREFLTDLKSRRGPPNPELQIIFHDKNQGKGGAIKTGFLACTGDAVIIQDADLEYDPADYRALLQPLIEGEADVVYGSRFSHIDGPVHHYWHRWGNQLLTRLSNWKSGWTLTDVETCYKLIRRELVQRIASQLRERGFGIEIELTMTLARLPGVRFYERPVSYAGRSWTEGKKIGVKDGLWAIWCILRY